MPTAHTKNQGRGRGREGRGGRGRKNYKENDHRDSNDDRGKIRTTNSKRGADERSPREGINKKMFFQQQASGKMHKKQAKLSLVSKPTTTTDESESENKTGKDQHQSNSTNIQHHQVLQDNEAAERKMENDDRKRKEERDMALKKKRVERAEKMSAHLQAMERKESAQKYGQQNQEEDTQEHGGEKKKWFEQEIVHINGDTTDDDGVDHNIKNTLTSDEDEMSDDLEYEE